MKIAACVLVKDEEHDFLEWCCFHLAVGFDTILVYDNFSADRTAEVARLAGRIGDVRVRQWEAHPRQTGAYADAVREHGGEFDWIAFIDSDEYLFAPGHRDLKAFLAGFADVPAVAVNWLCFGSSGIPDFSDQLIMEQFVRRAPVDFSANRHVKSIVRPREVLRPVNPHYCALRDDAGYRDGDHAAIADWVKPGKRRSVRAIDRVRIHHYFTRSVAHYARKLVRGRGDEGPLKHRFELMDRNDERDEGALVYLDRVRALMAEARDAAG